jgi:arsenate reductase
MAEGLARALAAPGVEVASAGTHPSDVSPRAIEAMRERGIDISGHRSKGLDDLSGEFDYVITLCDSAAQSCPTLSARRSRLHWPFPDPGFVPGDEARRLAAHRETRNAIEQRLREWLREQDLLTAESNPLVEKVRVQLAQYEHPLFDFEAHAAGDGAEVQIRFRPPDPEVHTYVFQLRPREIEHAQFPWTFQKHLYDCLHDYIIEMFTRNPQREN